jgi:hypothetical protein
VAINKHKSHKLHFSYNKGEAWKEFALPFIFEEIKRLEFLGEDNDSFILILQGKEVKFIYKITFS